MPAAPGKKAFQVVLPEDLKEQLDADATERGLDRSTWLTMVLQSSYDEQGHSQASRLDQLLRDHVALREQVEQIAISLRELVETLQKAPATPAKKVYPPLVKLEDVYPEVKAMRQPVDQNTLLAARLAEHRAANPPAPVKKGLRRWLP